MKAKTFRVTVETGRVRSGRGTHRAYACVDTPRTRSAFRCGRGDATSATAATAAALEDLARVLRRRK